MISNLIVEAEADEGGAPRELRREHGVGGGGGSHASSPPSRSRRQRARTTPSVSGRRARAQRGGAAAAGARAADAVEVDEHDLRRVGHPQVVKLDVDVRPAVGPQRLQCAEQLSVDGVRRQRAADLELVGEHRHAEDLAVGDAELLRQVLEVDNVRVVAEHRRLGGDLPLEGRRRPRRHRHNLRTCVRLADR